MKNGVIISILVIALIIIVGVFYYNSVNKADNSFSVEDNSNRNDLGLEEPGNGEIVPVENIGTTHIIEISGFSFSPEVLNIKKGDKVIWTNMDSVQHTVTSDSGSTLESKLIGKGESYSYLFNQGGSYSYHCIPHPAMKGKIVVN